MMKRNSGELLIIFYRNPIVGRVKTRLAATIGVENALRVYHWLIAHTRSITQNLDMDVSVFYSDHIDYNDTWDNNLYQKQLQSGTDLGARMNGALIGSLGNVYESVCIIGTDCFELDPSIIKQAFDDLRNHDSVIGPARDGGYYLIGFKGTPRDIFHDKNWGTSTVYDDTISDFNNLGLNYSVLPILGDVDVESDLPPSIRNSIQNK